MTRRPLLILLGLVLVSVAGGALYMKLRPVHFTGTTYDPPMQAPSFELTEHTGRPIRLADFAGQPVLLFFGFTHCPDVCPITLARLRQTLDDLGAGPDDARVIMITVDPARDSVQALASYVARFGPGVSGVTGPAAELASLAKAYGVHTSGGGANTGHAMMHTSAVFGIDSQGRIRVLMHASDPQTDLEGDVGTLLRL